MSNILNSTIGRQFFFPDILLFSSVRAQRTYSVAYVYTRHWSLTHAQVRSRTFFSENHRCYYYYFFMRSPDSAYDRYCYYYYNSKKNFRYGSLSAVRGRHATTHQRWRTRVCSIIVVNISYYVCVCVYIYIYIICVLSSHSKN